MSVLIDIKKRNFWFLIKNWLLQNHRRHMLLNFNPLLIMIKRNLNIHSNPQLKNLKLPFLSLSNTLHVLTYGHILWYKNEVSFTLTEKSVSKLASCHDNSDNLFLLKFTITGFEPVDQCWVEYQTRTQKQYNLYHISRFKVELQAVTVLLVT